MFFLHRGVDGLQLGASLVESGSGRETAEELGHAMNAAGDHGRGEMMRAGDNVGDDFGVLRVWDAGFEDANDFRRTFTNAAEANGLADDRRILAKRGGPETIGEDDDSGGVGAIVLRPDETSEAGMRAHD